MQTVTTDKTSATALSAFGAAKGVMYFAYCQKESVAIKVMAYPTERLRLLMQTQHTNQTFRGVSFSTLRATLGHMQGEGALAPWRGLTPTLVRWFPSQSIILFLKDNLNGYFPSYSKTDNYGKWMGAKVGAGAATGVLNALVWAYPFDVIRQQLATKNSGSWRNAVSQIYSNFGMRGFYRGFVMDAPGLAIFRGVQLGGWDLMKEHYGSRWVEMGVLSQFFHGQMVSLMGSVCAYPWDTVRRNLIGYDTQASYAEVFRAGVANAGGLRRFFYAGFAARVLSSFVNGALLVGFDEWKRTAH